MRCAGLRVAIFLLAAAVPLRVSADPAAKPCTVADVPNAAVRQAFAVAERPIAWIPPPPRSKWSVLVPAKVGLWLHDGVRAGIGWTDSFAGQSGRWTQFDDQFVRLLITWDLRPLTAQPPARRPPDLAERIEPLIKVEQLAQRAAEAIRALRKAQALAATTAEGEPLCREMQGEAEAAALILDALIAAAR